MDVKEIDNGTDKTNRVNSSKYNLWKKRNDQNYLINTKSKAVAQINDNEISLIKAILAGKEECIEDQRYELYLQELKKRGYLVDNNTNELELLEYEYNRKYFQTTTLTISLMTTKKCNFNCIYCCQEYDKNSNWTEDSIEILKKFAKKNFKYKENIQILLAGGEPLLEWDKVQNVMDYILTLKDEYEFNIMTGTVTNGSLLERDVIEKLLNKYYCKMIGVSFGGDEEMHNKTRPFNNGEGSYKSVIKNFKELLRICKNMREEDRPIILLMATIFNIKETHVHKLFDEFTEDEKELFRIQFNPSKATDYFNERNENLDDFEKFYKIADERGIKKIIVGQKDYSFCVADSGPNNFSIFPNLHLKKCFEDLSTTDVGMVDENGNYTLDTGKMALWARKNPFKNDQCMKCIYLPMCFGGCPTRYKGYNKNGCFQEKKFELTSFFLDWGYTNGLIGKVSDVHIGPTIVQ